ncbi:MAG: PilZ domain-containing protein [Alphaproteobacteria bacterium]|nr:PilZ domain-containing protein [Alphaproteobacteria bacterium]
MTASSKGAERRRHNRHPSRKRVVVVLDSAEGAFAGSLRDISSGGALFAPRVTPKEIPTHRIELVFPGHRIPAMLLGNSPAGLHISFPEPLDEELVLLIAERYID